MNNTISIVSGGFDPIHEGHIYNIIEARSISDGVVAIINSDEGLIRKKGKFFQNIKTRDAIVSTIKGVLTTLVCDDSDGTVCDGLRKIRKRFPDDFLIFCKGGDRVEGTVPEIEVCKELGITVKYGVGGDKINSSSELLKKGKEGN